MCPPTPALTGGCAAIHATGVWWYKTECAWRAQIQACRASQGGWLVCASLTWPLWLPLCSQEFRLQQCQRHSTNLSRHSFHVCIDAAVVAFRRVRAVVIDLRLHLAAARPCSPLASHMRNTRARVVRPQVRRVSGGHANQPELEHRGTRSAGLLRPPGTPHPAALPCHHPRTHDPSSTKSSRSALPAVTVETLERPKSAWPRPFMSTWPHRVS